APPSASAAALPRPSRTTELGLLFLAWVITTGLYILASLGAQGHMPKRLVTFLAVIIGITLVMHVAIRIFAPRSSQVLLPIATLLNGIGYVEIARWNPTRAGYQAVWFLLSAGALVATLAIVRRVRDLDRYRYLTLFTAIGLLLLPLVPHFGENVYGARLWVKVGPLTFQPVEIAKILLCFVLASYLSTNRELLTTATQRVGSRLIVPPRTLLPILFAWGFAIAVLGAENDVGFPILLFILFLGMLWVATGRETYVFVGVTLFVGGGLLASQFFHQIHDRISWWLNPWSHAALNSGGLQLAYGWFSLAAGGITGTGLGLGQSGTVPEITSDMIFAAVGEELGFLGVIVVLCLFTLFVGEGFRIAQRAHSDYVRLAAAALTATVGIQAFVIMGGVLRILPFTGITLPFMAYGGSSLLANYVIVGLLLRISDENATVPRGGEIRPMATIT
ncbi:MAG TPA: FtsW/RodA/SpoVE family cell cycle protein, partial [Acidimicrobiales bacterium]|nr:FtsW/RodA/SpoVE family cell cycle protein [Acidimicrobiales bacterium]